MQPDPANPARRGSSCWLQGCLVLAMVVSAALVIVLIGMVLFRIEESADRPRMPRGAWVVPADAPLTG